jgi:hypothetical protein
MAHREEGLTDGGRREIYGIGERYRALKGDEPAIRRALHEDGRGLRSPVYFRFILAVDNPTAARFQRLDGHLSERVLRDAVEKTLRGAARGAQGSTLAPARPAPWQVAGRPRASLPPGYVPPCRQGDADPDPRGSMAAPRPSRARSSAKVTGTTNLRAAML